MQIEMTRQGRLSGSTAGFCARRVAGIARMLIGVAVLCCCTAASAVEMTSLYTVQVPLESNDADSRNFAFQAALTEVLVRVTGTTAVVDSEEIAQLFPNPARYVQQFSRGPDN
jgi:hypothetical protein